MAIEPTTVHRPFGITLIEVLGIINGVVSIALGIFLILDRNRTADFDGKYTSSQLVAIGVAAIVFGVIQALLARALGHGSRTVRILYAVVVLFNIAAGIWALAALHGEQRMNGAVSAVVSLFVLYLLFNERADRWFEEVHGH